MSRVLAGIDNSAAAAPVLAMAAALAPLLGAAVDAVHVTERSAEQARTAGAAAQRHDQPLRRFSGDPYEVLVALAAEDDVVAVVVGARGRPSGPGPVGHLALALAGALTMPVVVVPPDFSPPARLRRVLVAMEGTPAKARALERAVELAVGADAELVVVHVDDERTIPAFSDQVQHEAEAYAGAFLSRYVRSAPAARLELRVGSPAEEIMAVARTVGAELIALGWPRALARERGAVARQVVERSEVPVLLVALA
jgi:nucleotide-binding universal stress UspA family protein